MGLRLREFAILNRVPHAWLDLEEDEGEDEGAEALLRELDTSYPGIVGTGSRN
ncbi:MAG: hypothetical protein M3309_08455 [Actinomycetota bacterium]|nr:hypothetical protein [Actinomycetota bacterium]